MEKYFANYNQSLALKELGFDMPCFRYIYTGDTGNNIDRYEEVVPSRAKNYNKYFLCVSQPLKSQVFEWFRKEHKLHGNAIIAETNCGFKIQYLSDYINQWFASYESYEEAESACIDKLIEIVKNK
jgi:hypothetical protein